MKIVAALTVSVWALAANSAANKSEVSLALKSTLKETFESANYYQTVAEYEQWQKGDFPDWKTKWELLAKNIDQFVTSKSGRDKDIANNMVELLKLQIKLLDSQNINNPAALDSLKSVASSSRSFQNQLQSLKFYLPGKKDSQSLLIEFAKALDSAAQKSRQQLERLIQKKERLDEFKSVMGDAKKNNRTNRMNILCAQLRAESKSLSARDTNELKQIMSLEKIAFLENDNQKMLCNKYLEKRAGKVPLSAFALKILQEEASARAEEDKAISDEQIYLNRKKRLLKVEKLGEAFAPPVCGTEMLGNTPYTVKIDETLKSTSTIKLPSAIYKKLITATATYDLNAAPLMELTAENKRKILVRYQDDPNLREGISVSSAIAKLLSNTSTVKAKWCLGVPTAASLHFIAFDAQNIDDVKSKVHAQLESALEGYGGLTVGLKLSLPIEEKTVTLAIEKILDTEGNNVSAAQIPVALEAEFEVRTEAEAFDAENNIIPITDKNN